MEGANILDVKVIQTHNILWQVLVIAICEQL